MNLKSPAGSVRRQRPDSEEAVQENGRVDGHTSKNSSLQGEDDETDIPFDKGWAWMISLSCFIIFYVYAGYDQAVSVLLVDIMRDLETTVSVVSIMFSVSTCFYCLSTQLTNNLLLNHMTNRCLQTVAAVVNVLATLMFVIHPNSTLFLVAAFIKAAAKGTSLISTMTMVGHYFKRRRALAVALGLMGGSVCSISVPPLTRYLRDEYGLRGCFLLVAGLEMHAVMATMILRPINSYRKRKLRVREGVNGGINEEEKRLLLSRTIQEVNSSSPITVTETVKSRLQNVTTSDEDVQHSDSRGDPILSKDHNKADDSPFVPVSREEASGLRAAGLETTNQNGADLFERRSSVKKIPVSVHSSLSGSGARFHEVVDSGNLCSDGSGNKYKKEMTCRDELTCCLDKETAVNFSLEAQPLKDVSSENIVDRGDNIERIQQTEVHITDTHINGKNTLDIPKVDTKLPDKCIADKDSISTSTGNLQSKDTNIFDIGYPDIYIPGRQKHDMRTQDMQTNDTQRPNSQPEIQTHDIQTNDTERPESQTPDQDETTIIIVGKDRRDPFLTRSFPSRWNSLSSSIIGSDLDIQAIAEENVPTVNQSFKETKTGISWKMTSWIHVIINVSLLKNALCLSIVFIYCLTNGGILNMTYLPSYARHVGIASQDAAILMTVLGACDMAARILSGYFVDLKILKVYIIMGVSIFISGVVTQCLGLFLTFELLTFYVVVQGLIGSVGASLNTVLIVETLGIDYLSKVLPMCSLFLNVSIAIQQLIVGSLIEYTKNYVVAFQYVGCMYLLSSILLLGLPIVRRLQQKKENNN